MLARSAILSRSLRQVRHASTVSDAALHGLEQRWTRLPECEQAAVAEKLAELQRGDWKQMTQDQKRAGKI
jgi:cytochrome c oxidase subunit 4